MPRTAPVDMGLLRAFAAVCETGSFSRAAERLGGPRSTVSRAISTLEGALGVRLLSRTTRSVQPTAEGRALYERTAPLMDQLDRAVAELPKEAQRPEGVVRVTAAPDMATALLAEAAARFVARFPEVTVALSASTRVVDVVQEGFDFGLRVTGGALRGAGITTQRLGTVTIRLYASPLYLSRAGTPRTVDEVAHHAFAAFRGPSSPAASVRLVGDLPVVRARVESDDMTFVREAARLHVGLAALPSFLGDPDVERGLLAPVLPSWHGPRLSIHLVRPSGRNLPARASLFREALVATLRNRPLSTG